MHEVPYQVLQTRYGHILDCKLLHKVGDICGVDFLDMANRVLTTGNLLSKDT